MYSVPRVRFSLICIDYLAYSIIVSVLPLSTHWFLPTRLVESSNDYRVTRKTQDSTLHHTTPHSLVFFFFFFSSGQQGRRVHTPPSNASMESHRGDISQSTIFQLRVPPLDAKKMCSEIQPKGRVEVRVVRH